MLNILFWTLLSDGCDNSLGSFDNLGMNLIPFLLLSADFIINSYVFPIRDLVFTFILSIIYLIINKINACNGHPAYPNVFDCNNWLFPFLIIAILAVIHIGGHILWIFWGLKILKKKKNSESLFTEQ